jgi:type IV secretory pathway protease TraF
MRKATVLSFVLLLVAGTALAANELIITEIMYNSSEATDVEWFEVYNASDATLDLTAGGPSTTTPPTRIFPCREPWRPARSW